MIEKFKGLIDFYFVILTVIVAFVLFFIDANKLNQKGLEKEKKIARVLSVILIIVGPFMYILSLIL